MKKWILIGAGVILLAVIVVANLVKDDTPSVEARTAKVERRTLTASISAPGKLRAVSSVDISAEVPGRIVQLLVEEGQRVEEGQLLLRLDDAQYRSRVEQVQASLRSAKASLALAEARLEKAKSDQDRLQALHERGLASEEALQTAQTDYRVALAEVEARHQESARVEASLIDARDDLEKTLYHAPVAGIVSRLNVEQGEIVITGTMNNPGTVILTIADMSRMEVEAEVDETDVISVQVGQKSKVTVDAIPDTSFSGKVVQVGSAGRERGTGTTEQVINFDVKVLLDENDMRLKTGMTADVEVETETRENVLAVPIQALVARSRGTLEKDREAVRKRHPKSAALAADSAAAPGDTLKGSDRERWEKEVVEGVYVVADGKTAFVPVTAGIADETMIEVRGGLNEDDTVVTGPFRVLRTLKEGARIKELKGEGKGEEPKES